MATARIFQVTVVVVASLVALTHSSRNSRYFYSSATSGTSSNVSSVPFVPKISVVLCRDKPLEHREESAAIIFTGTVERIVSSRRRRKHRHNEAIDVDFRGPAALTSRNYVAVVRVKRVMKESESSPPIRRVRNGQMVVVQGLGDPAMCHSHVKERDTRIFLMGWLPNGHLRLNSSLVKLTLRNLFKVEAAIKGECTEVLIGLISGVC